jgi:hypothetical protein
VDKLNRRADLRRRLIDALFAALDQDPPVMSEEGPVNRQWLRNCLKQAEGLPRDELINVGTEILADYVGADREKTRLLVVAEIDDFMTMLRWRLRVGPDRPRVSH